MLENRWSDSIGARGQAALVLLLAITLAGTGCGARHLPPRTAPPRAAPSLPAPSYAPEERHGRIYFDVVGERATVFEVLEIDESYRDVPAVIMTGAGAILTSATVRDVRKRVRPLCNTPCFAELPFGHHMVGLAGLGREDSDVVSLEFTPQDGAYRHALGRKDQRDVGATLGAGSVLGLGIALALVGPLLLAVDENTAGIVMTASGAGLTVLGAVLLLSTRPVEQDGQGTFWRLHAR